MLSKFMHLHQDKDKHLAVATAEEVRPDDMGEKQNLTIKSWELCSYTSHFY